MYERHFTAATQVIKSLVCITKGDPPFFGTQYSGEGLDGKQYTKGW